MRGTLFRQNYNPLFFAKSTNTDTRSRQNHPIPFFLWTI